MSVHLLIVESPAKAKTLNKYLGKDFKVMASFGHVRDLIPKEGAVDPNNHFATKYELIDRNRKHVDAILKELKQADSLLLATDPDREGEAIAWHLYEIAQTKKALKDKPVQRIVFHEITKNAVLEALKNPRDLSMDLVNAQQARRVLDYLVGFQISPLLWKKIRRGLSAGRVQSPALRMIVDRELEIERFQPKEYWNVTAACLATKQPFNAKLAEYAGEKISQFSVIEAKQAGDIRTDLLNRANGKLKVTKVTQKQRKRNPAAPFITSTLQQEASRKLGFTAKRTMRVAQQLYEGVDTDQGTTGLISYMRTDSVNLSQEAITEIRALIKERFGNDNLPPQPRLFRTSAKNAQEAHEAIRPTSVFRLPEAVKAYLTDEQYKLYDLIWKRTIACQMLHATLNTVSVDLNCGEGYRFHATGSVIANPGFMAVYEESVDDAKSDDDEQKLLPPLKEGEWVDLTDITTTQHFTEPPPRYGEASLVKALEEHGIGRPSTYATIISTLQQREYVILDKKRFYPTDVGRVVNRFLTEYFGDYVDYQFTAKLEDELDAISRGEAEWLMLMTRFWQPFKERIDFTAKNVQRKDVTQEAMDENCPKCSKPLSIRLGRRGRFVGCSGYPDCDYTRNIGEDSLVEPERITDRACSDCGSELVIKSGKYGKFIGCSNYPKCKHIEPLEKPADTGVECPVCHKGSLLKRKSRNNKIFYSCSGYPTCKYAIWNEPINQHCPQCNWPILTLKTTQRRGMERVCPQKECGYTEPFEQETADG